MKNIFFHKNFEKKYKKLDEKDKKRFKERLNLFLIDEFNPLLNNHTLKGSFIGYRSLNINGDLRLVYKKIQKDYFFVDIDNHNNLYK
ncbi:MAG: type II toxin-antitoxin system mRNA interferase toxin, RelE/StbE family [Candidatus Pacebacteria bacterium]|nr:type II toxin-antitoxin system mRNA interferase toxin, RelE/StbE family [Candidatus Paceibacterota bacterium]